MKKHYPLVSVIIPLYNREQFLQQAFNSIAAQDYPNFEVILIDDGSTDNTRRWVDINIDQLSFPVRYFYQENQGPYAARNLGLSHARGVFIALQDSDDEWPSYHLSEFVGFLVRNSDVDWVFGSIKRIEHSTGKVRSETNFIRKDGTTQPFLLLNSEQRGEYSIVNDKTAGEIALLYGVPGSLQCAMIRKDVFAEIQFDPSFRTAYDRFLEMRCVLHGFRFAFTYKTHQIYHIHDDHISLVNSTNINKLEKSALTMIRGYKQIQALYNLSSPEKNALNLKLAHIHAWELANAYWRQGNIINAINAKAKAITYKPLQLVFYKSFLSSIFKYCTSKF